MCISKELIEDRINNFWGYGNLNSKYWFIAMEEGTGGNIKELTQRFIKTKGKSVLDCNKDMLDIPEHIKYYSGITPPLQSTTSKLIRVLLNILNDDKVDTEKIRNFQRDKFGRLDSNHCSLEFMPLPVPNTDSWIYKCVDIDYLSDRQSYNYKIMPKRIKLFHELISNYKPSAVIFSGLTYYDKWEQISNTSFTQIGNKISYSKSNNINFFIIPHPGSYLKNSDWDEFGKIIKNKISSKS